MNDPIVDELHSMGLGVKQLQGDLQLHKQERDSLIREVRVNKKETEESIQKLKDEHITYLYPTERRLNGFMLQTKVVIAVLGFVGVVAMSVFTFALSILGYWITKQ